MEVLEYSPACRVGTEDSSSPLPPLGYANPPGPVIAGTVCGAGIGGFMNTKVDSIISRLRGPGTDGLYAISLRVQIEGVIAGWGYGRNVGPSCIMQTTGLINDFGDLVVVERWMS